MNKNKIFLGLILLVLSFTFSACSDIYPPMKALNELKETEFIDTNSSEEDDGYLCIEYNGRTYIPYGVIEGHITKDDINECLGYINYNKDSKELDTSLRVYSLTSDSEMNFLLEDFYDITWMNVPMFLRALDTKNKEIYIPEFIGSLDYEIWK